MDALKELMEIENELLRVAGKLSAVRAKIALDNIPKKTNEIITELHTAEKEEKHRD